MYAKPEWIIVPHATHVSARTVEALSRYVKAGGKLIFAGKGNLAWDEYHRPQRMPLPAGVEVSGNGNERETAALVRSVMIRNGMKLTELQDSAGTHPAWGVEYRIVPYHGALLVSLINFLHQPQNVRLILPGKAIDLLSGEAVDLKSITLESMEPRLLEIRQ